MSSTTIETTFITTIRRNRDSGNIFDLNIYYNIFKNKQRAKAREIARRAHDEKLAKMEKQREDARRKMENR